MTRKPDLLALSTTVCGVLLAGTSIAQEPFSETKAIIEINASDGDIGFHVLLDADAWHQVRIDDPNGKRLFQEFAKGPLADQGLTENFFESAEPLWSEHLVEEEGDEVVTLDEFLDRFAAGPYIFSGKSNEGDTLAATALLTYNLPAAPDIDGFDGTGNVPTNNAVVSWAHGDDLGECPYDGLIPEPGSVVEVGWELTVEPEDADSITPNRIFRVQLPPAQTSVTVPQEFLDTYVAQGITVFKFEVGAIEASGNQTFSEGSFCTSACPED